MRRKLRFEDEQLPDRFEVIELLGRGAMGEVYRAHDRDLGREVAVKVLLESAWTPELSERYQREARELERVRHPNVVGFYGQGTHEGRAFLVLEYVSGGDLRAYLRQPRERNELLLLFVGLCRGLAELHARGLIHRDLKPENVLIGADGQARLTDLGLVRATDSSSRLTSEGALVGTFSYLAPEQITAGEASPASDLYALGACLYEAFAGRPVFQGRTEFELLERHVRAEPDSPGVTPELDSLIVRLLAKKPEDRPSLEEVSRGLLASLSLGATSAVQTARTGLVLSAVEPDLAQPAQSSDSTAASTGLARPVRGGSSSVVGPDTSASSATGTGPPPPDNDSNTARFQMMLASKLELEGRRKEALNAYRRAYRLAEEGSAQQRELAIILEELQPRKRSLALPLLILLLACLAGASFWWLQRQTPVQLAALPPIELQGPPTTRVPVKLSVLPAGARVEVDGQPVEGPLELWPGTHRLKVSHPHHQAEERTLTVEEGKPLELSVKLAPAPVAFRVLVTPPPARVALLDGQGKKLSEQVVPKAGTELRALPGEYTLRASRQGHRSLSRKLSVKPGLEPVKLALEELPPPPPPPPVYREPLYVPPPPVYYPPAGGGGRSWNTK
ncbi:MAG: hypothetical protein AMXMBFR33_08840 [Candidatus Xenobia bacterium]